MRKGYTMTYQMRKKQRQQREIIIQYALKFVGVVLLAFLIVRFVCFSFTIQGEDVYKRQPENRVEANQKLYLQDLELQQFINLLQMV